MSRYAAKTTVSADRSRGELEQVLQRYGARAFSYAWMEHEGGMDAVVAFVADDRQVQFHIPMPDPRSREFTHTKVRMERRSAEDAHKQWEQACRQRWRALVLVVKAKLEAVEAGITDFEEEFLAHIVLPKGQTVGRWLRPQLDRVYAEQEMPSLVPGVQPQLAEGEIEGEVVDG